MNRLTLIEHEACDYRWWSRGELPPVGACVSCGAEQPEWTVTPLTPTADARELAEAAQVMTACWDDPFHKVPHDDYAAVVVRFETALASFTAKHPTWGEG